MLLYFINRFYAIRLFACLTTLGFIIGPVTAQTPFSLKTGREVGIFGGVGIGLGGAWYLNKKMPALTVSDINGLKVESVPGFERFVTRQFDLRAKTASDWSLYTGVAIPALLLLDAQIRNDAPVNATIIGEAMLLNLTVTSLMKDIVQRPRPFVYNPNAPMDWKLKKDARQSFFSGHTSMVAAATFSTASVWSAYHPDSKWKPLVWAGAAVLPITTGILRVKAGKHFITDVACGFLVGAVIGWVVPKWHK